MRVRVDVAAPEAVIASGTEFETTSASRTATITVPAAAGGVTTAVSVVESTHVVVLSSPSVVTKQVESKFVPVTVSVKIGLPANTDAGLTLVTVGADDSTPIPLRIGS